MGDIDVVFNTLAIELVRPSVRRHRAMQVRPLLVCDLVDTLGLDDSTARRVLLRSETCSMRARIRLLA
jgi:hypothetical protein